MSQHNSISPEDPRLTAYALNEMEPAERSEFEQLLRSDPAARSIVDEIASTTATLSRTLAGEALPATEALAHPMHDQLPKIRRFPYYWISGLAAACFAVGFVIWQAGYQAPGAKHYMEIDLTKLTPVKNDQPAATSEADQSVVAIGQAAQEEMKARQASRSAETAKVSEPTPAAGTLTRGGTATVVTAAPEPTSRPKDAGRLESAESLTRPALDLVSISTPAAPSAATGAPMLDRELGNAGRPAAPVELEPVAPNAVTTGAPAEQVVKLEAFTVSADTRGRGNRVAAKVAAPLGQTLGTVVVGGAAGSILHDVEQERGYISRPDNFNTEAYDRVTDNPFNAVTDHPLSTFSIDVDTASYSNLRRFVQGGRRPPRDAVRIEELVNYFPYDYAAPEPIKRGEGTPPTSAEVLPFATSMEVASAPWQPGHRLVRIGLKGREVPRGERGAANLVFLLDVSGSMNQPNKLPLVQESMRLLVDKLRDDDQVAIAVYAGASGLALPSTRASDKSAIKEAIDALRAGGSTNGAMGIQLAYDIAKANFVKGGINRVILCTDGDFNVGVTNRGELERLIEEKAKSGVFLTVLGFGMGNYKDSTLEKLADKGNGNYGYVDTRREAQKLLVEQAGGTLVTIAKDVKIQVEFNPAQAQAYRLIGYENRMLRKEDFNNDKIDAGEIGSGHTVTALYEIVPAGVEWKPDATVDPLKYQRTEAPTSRLQPPGSGELLTLKLRYKAPDGDTSKLLEFPLRDTGAKFAAASTDFKFAVAVAAFGMILRDSPHKGGATLADVSAWASAGTGRDTGGYRSEFLGLVKLSEALVR